MSRRGRTVSFSAPADASGPSPPLHAGAGPWASKAGGANPFGTLCPISLDAHFDIQPRSFALQMMQRLGATGIENLERAVRSRGPRGITNDEFVEAAVRCLGVAASLPDSCAYPWQRKALRQGATNVYEAEPMLGGFVPDVIDAHAGLNFADVSRGYPFHTAQGGSVVRRERDMAEYRRRHTGITKRGDARFDNAPTQTIQPFETVAAVEYALACLYLELDPCHSDRLCWEDVAAYLADVTDRGVKVRPTPEASLEALPYNRVKRKTARVFGDPHEAFRLSMNDPSAYNAVSFSKLMVPPASRRMYATTSRGEMVILDARSFETRAPVAAYDASWGPVVGHTFLDGGLLALGTKDDCKLHVITEEGENSKLLWTQAFGTPQSALMYVPSARRLIAGAMSGFVTIGALPQHRAGWRDSFNMTKFTSANQESVLDMCYIERGGLVGLGCGDGAVRMYDLDTAVSRVSPIITSEAVHSIDYNTHYSLLAVASGNSPMLWAPDDPRCVPAALRDAKDTHRVPLRTVHFSTTSPTVISADRNGVVKVWDVRTLSCICTRRTCGSVDLVHATAGIEPDGSAAPPSMIAVGPRMLEKLRPALPTATERDDVDTSTTPSAALNLTSEKFLRPRAIPKSAKAIAAVKRRQSVTMNSGDDEESLPPHGRGAGGVQRPSETYFHSQTHDGRLVLWDVSGAPMANLAIQDRPPAPNARAADRRAFRLREARSSMAVLPMEEDAKRLDMPFFFVGRRDGTITRYCPIPPLAEDAAVHDFASASTSTAADVAVVATSTEVGATNEAMTADEAAQVETMNSVESLSAVRIAMRDDGSGVGLTAHPLLSSYTSTLALVIRRKAAGLALLPVGRDSPKQLVDLDQHTTTGGDAAADVAAAPLPSDVLQGNGLPADVTAGTCVWSEERRVFAAVVGTNSNAVRIVMVRNFDDGHFLKRYPHGGTTEDTILPVRALLDACSARANAVRRRDARRSSSASSSGTSHGGEAVPADEGLDDVCDGETPIDVDRPFGDDGPVFRVTTIRTEPSVSAISQVTYVPQISGVITLDLCGGVKLFNLPFEAADRMYPTCIFRSSSFQPSYTEYVPRPASCFVTHHGLLGIAAGTSIAYLDLTMVAAKALPQDWCVRHLEPITILGDTVLPIGDQALEGKRETKADDATVDANALVSARESNVQHAIVADRFKVLPPTPQVVHNFELHEAISITGVAYDAERQLILVSGADGRIHTTSLWGAAVAIGTVPRAPWRPGDDDDELDETASEGSDEDAASDAASNLYANSLAPDSHTDEPSLTPSESLAGGAVSSRSPSPPQGGSAAGSRSPSPPHRADGGRSPQPGTTTRSSHQHHQQPQHGGTRDGGAGSGSKSGGRAPSRSPSRGVHRPAVSVSIVRFRNGQLPLKNLTDDVPNPWASSVFGARARRTTSGKRLFRSAVRAVQISASLADDSSKAAMREMTTVVEPVRRREPEKQDAPYRTMSLDGSGGNVLAGSSPAVAGTRGGRLGHLMSSLRSSGSDLGDSTMSASGEAPSPTMAGSLQASEEQGAPPPRTRTAQHRVVQYGAAKRVLDDVASANGEWVTLPFSAQVTLLETLESLTGEMDDDGPFSVLGLLKERRAALQRLRGHLTGGADPADGEQEAESDGDVQDRPLKYLQTWGKPKWAGSEDGRQPRVQDTRAAAKVHSQPSMRDRLDLALNRVDRILLYQFRKLEDVEMPEEDKTRVEESSSFHRSKAQVLESFNRRRANFEQLCDKRWRSTVVGDTVYVRDHAKSAETEGKTFELPPDAVTVLDPEQIDAEQQQQQRPTTSAPSSAGPESHRRGTLRSRMGASAGRSTAQSPAPGVATASAGDAVLEHQRSTVTTDGIDITVVLAPRPASPHAVRHRGEPGDSLMRIAHRAVRDAGPAEQREPQPDTVMSTAESATFGPQQVSLASPQACTFADQGGSLDRSQSLRPSMSESQHIPARMTTPPLARRVLHQRKSGLYYAQDFRWTGDAQDTDGAVDGSFIQPLVAEASSRLYGDRRPSSALSSSAKWSAAAAEDALRSRRPPSAVSDRSVGGDSSSAASVVQGIAQKHRSRSAQGHRPAQAGTPQAERGSMRGNVAFSLDCLAHRVNRPRPKSSSRSSYQH